MSHTVPYGQPSRQHRGGPGPHRQRARAGGPGELCHLVAAFNEMADAVETSRERQRTFVADASHQLRNPLSALMLRLDSLRLMLPEDLSGEFGEVSTEARRLAYMLEKLQALAAADQMAGELEVVDVIRLAAGRGEAWAPVAGARDIRLVTPAGPPVLACADVAAAGRALDAVIDNAVKFSPPGGTVRIDVDGGDDGGRLAGLHVTDEGPGLSGGELARAGDRFWRAPRHQNVPGSGLGLSTARALLEAGGGRLEIARAPGSGLRVTLRLLRALTGEAGDDTEPAETSA